MEPAHGDQAPQLAGGGVGGGTILEGTARYAGLLVAPGEGFRLWLRFFCPLGKQKRF